jgi:hypothetical protein
MENLTMLRERKRTLRRKMWKRAGIMNVSALLLGRGVEEM